MIRLALIALCVAAPAAAAERGFPATGFDRVAVSGSPDVFVTAGGAHAVSATGSQARIDSLDIRVEGRTLKIGSKPGRWNWGRNDTVRINVALPALHGASVAGSADLVADRGSGPAFVASVAGSGDLTVQRIDADSVELALNGSGDITVAGRCGRAVMALRGSGDINAGDLACRDLQVSVAGSGDVIARANGNATAGVAGSGDIVIRGGARCTKTEAGSGRVRCE